MSGLNPSECTPSAGVGFSAQPLCHLAMMSFEIIGETTDIETLAVGSGIREVQKQYGKGRWRKLKGIAQIRLAGGRIRLAELHWYEAHGIGKKETKRKRYLD